MALCRFRIPDTMYEQFKDYCKGQNKTITDFLMQSVATALNGSSISVATELNEFPVSVATVATKIKVNKNLVATDKWIEFDPFTGEPINH